MISSFYTPNEKQRLAALYKTELLDTPFEAEFTEIVQLASKICKTPISTITLIDSDHQWFKAEVGLGLIETGRDIAFCSHTILDSNPLMVEDAYLDERFFDNPLVTGDPYIRSYTGVPLATSDGYNIGTLCVIDTIPRKLDEEQLFAINILANQVMRLIDLRIKSRQMQELTEHLQRVSSITAHDVRNPLHALNSIIAMRTSNQISAQETQALLPLVQKQLDSTLNMLDNLVEWGKMRATNLQPQKKQINLKQLVDVCITEVELNAELKQNTLTNLVAANTLLENDRNAISFMLRNLLSNAVKFTSKGTITISYNLSNQLHCITVQDSGIGMSGENITNSNQVNFKRRDGTGKEKGSGLGLSLVREQLAIMGGVLNFSSIPGQGTSVTLSFP